MLTLTKDETPERRRHYIYQILCSYHRYLPNKIEKLSMEAIFYSFCVTNGTIKVKGMGGLIPKSVIN